MGKLVEIKTKETDSNVDDFINKVTDESKRKDSYIVLELMQKATGEKPKMWGSSIIGFGNKIYKSPASGREVAWFKIGFSPRKANFSLHLVLDLKQHKNTLQKLGKYKNGVGCLYITRLSDVDITVLEQLIVAAANAK
ncbi:MAG: DUF1801 domain-containing protein [Saprospiraceae bacterium]|nr:DUF1801 domain-containing protein [Saprospiraceae bacterium]